MRARPPGFHLMYISVHGTVWVNTTPLPPLDSTATLFEAQQLNNSQHCSWKQMRPDDCIAAWADWLNDFFFISSEGSTCSMKSVDSAQFSSAPPTQFNPVSPTPTQSPFYTSQAPFIARSIYPGAHCILLHASTLFETVQLCESG